MSIKSACLLLLTLTTLHCHAAQYQITCGVATGYPPYQFQDQRGAPFGFDIEILTLVAAHAGLELIVHQDIFDEVFSTTIHTGKIDCIAGIELSGLRMQYLDFTRPYYERNIVVFALFRNNKINRLEDLIGKLITGDDQSSVDLILREKGLKDQIRIKRTESKSESMDLLASTQYQAVIMPKAVGLYLAGQKGIKLKTIYESDQPSPVAFAVKKGNRALLEMLDTAIGDLIDNKSIQQRYDKWFRH